MKHTHPRSSVNSLVRTFLIALLFFLFLPTVSFALTPIARPDVVPLQRIEYGTTLNYGVIAFSKAGINKVDFTITGQGYSGGVKTATEMTLNSRTDVWEYWVPISSSEFTSNGPITVAATVMGGDNDTKIVDTITLIVEAIEAYRHTEAWVDATRGNDSTGTVGNSNLPFLTIRAAISAAQTTNGGSSDGNIIYLEEGVYAHGGSAVTTNEWLTYTKSETARKEHVIINSGLLTTKYLRIKDITLQSTGSNKIVINDDGVRPEVFWFDGGRAIGSGKRINVSNPIHHRAPMYYSTNSYYTNSDQVMAWGPMARGAMVEDIGVDAFFNTPFLVNCTIKGIDPGTSGAHADAYQVATSNTDLPDNRIIYNFKATDLHVQGIFMTFEDHPNGTGTNCAFVNVMVEMREPSIGNPGHDFTPLILGGNAWDHLLLWHCSFPLGITGAGADFTNTSFIGNVFWQYFDVRPTSSGSNLSYAVYENPGNNDFLYNHFMNVYGETEPCTPTSADIAQDKSCPSYFARIVDSHQTGSVTTGGDVLDMANPASDGFGSPLADSILINRIPFPTVPADLYGNPRAGSPDVGAIERISAQDPAYMAPPADFKTAQ